MMEIQIIWVLYYNQNKWDLAEKFYLLEVKNGYSDSMYGLGLLFQNQNK
jgi:hypothetical protein